MTRAMLLRAGIALAAALFATAAVLALTGGGSADTRATAGQPAATLAPPTPQPEARENRRASDASSPAVAVTDDEPQRLSGDAARVAEVARFVVLAQTGAEVCRTHLTGAFVMTTFGSMARCEDDGADDNAVDQPTDAAVTDIRVNGNAATATVTMLGGSFDGVSGTWAFAKTNRWRVAVWGVDFLRSFLLGPLGPAYEPDGPDDPFADDVFRGCYRDKFHGLTDAAFERLFRDIMRENDRAARTVADFVQACALAPNALRDHNRREYEAALRATLHRQGLSAADADCVVRRSRSVVSDAVLSRMAVGQLTELPPAVQGSLDRVGLDCILSRSA